MELVRVDAQRAYEAIWERITGLEMAPGSPINDQELAASLNIGPAAVQEALKLLAYEGLVVVTPRHGLYVSDVNVTDLQQLSEMRLTLEGLSARLAAERATADDLIVLDALRQEHKAVLPDESRALFDVDRKFHRAVARAAHNRYLVDSLERFFGHSQRLWCLALPHLDVLSSSVEMHLQLVDAIRAGDADGAERIMREHVQGFYDEVRGILAGR